eukprot:3022408-Alexandrium_andersonii.AAC.1
MSSFLATWRRALLDLRASYRQGTSKLHGSDRSKYTLPEQTRRGVGPGVGAAAAVTQFAVTE